VIGESLSHFKISEKLGEGGMGVVYRGIDTALDRPVAIKILTPEAQRNEESIARFLREAKTASKLQHPAITTIYEFGVQDDLRYLVMEYIQGKTLKDILKNGALPVRQLLEIAIQIADALCLAGEKSIIHRDIKAENIMLTDRGHVKILDFGLAKMIETNESESHDSFKTMDGRVTGTIKYMSPEQALGADLDPRTDIFSTGVVLYEMAAGVPPFSGTSPSVVMAKILNQPPPPLADYNPNLPPALEKLIAKCLEKNRENRYQSASALLQDLRTIKKEIDRSPDLGATVVMQPAKDTRLTSPPVEKFRELVPASTPPGAAFSPVRAVEDNPKTFTPPPPPPPSPVSKPPTTAAAAPRTIPVFSKVWRTALGVLLKTIRRALIVAVSLYAVGCVALFFMPLVRPERLGRLAILVRWMHVAIDPAVDFLTNFLTFNTTFQEYNFLLPAMALITWFLQLAVAGRLEWLEGKITKPLKQPIPGAGLLAPKPGSVLPQGTRMSLLRDYAASKRLLNEVRKDLSFLAIDVVGSTKMKLGEEKIAIEHAFAEYKKFLERIFRECHCYKVAWTPDGVMTCFFSTEDAVAAGQKVLAELDWFNHDVHQLRTTFHVRTGISAGEVLFPEDKPLEEISDEVIDVAGHLQKYADPDTLWVSGTVFNRLSDRSGFVRSEKIVDNREVYVWKPASQKTKA
jgi:serine/threonine protein kinase/class 3 adenylate cyclase